MSLSFSPFNRMGELSGYSMFSSCRSTLVLPSRMFRLPSGHDLLVSASSMPVWLPVCEFSVVMFKWIQASLTSLNGLLVLGIAATVLLNTVALRFVVDPAESSGVLEGAVGNGKALSLSHNSGGGWGWQHDERFELPPDIVAAEHVDFTVYRECKSTRCFVHGVLKRLTRFWA
jgi:hypothetical protein